MGTRGLTKVIDTTGKLVVAQYGQWDHYPSGQGLNILHFIREYGVLDNLKPCLDKAFFIEREKVSDYTANLGESWEVFYPQFSRNTGSDILKVLYWSSGAVPLVDDSNFEQDELFCEGVFTINFQNNTFVTACGDYNVVIGFESLPNDDVYLKMFELQLAPA